MSTTSQTAGLQSLDIVSLVVDDIDEALEFYVETLGFEKRMDEEFDMGGDIGRWVTIGLPNDGVDISLTLPDEPYYDDETREDLSGRLGTTTWWTFRVADCEAAVDALERADVEITQEPTEYDWGTEAMVADPFGNEFGLFEYAFEE